MNNLLNNILENLDISSKKIILWGLGVFGLCTLKLLKEENIDVEAIIDRNAGSRLKEKNGINLYEYGNCLKNYDANDCITKTSHTPKVC